ncbi:MAG: AAA family ATPase [Bacteroidales bacterium]|nr:AAA family ATPase [Bacteroidales bacterium]
MIFNEIELQNFRQYKSPIKIPFSNPNNDKENITLIIAANGVGKTTLLQAFRYCFYGQKSAFLDLPNRDELVNNMVSSEMKELDNCEMKVSISFTHKNKKYLAIRRQRFVKRNGKLHRSGEEVFTLSGLTEYEGWKEFGSSDAQEKIQSILPDGLSQVFMFDGERMQRNFADKKFGEELRESILGILDIKKFDKLYDIIGSENRVNSVLGMLNKKIIAPTEKDQKVLDDYNRYLKSQKSLQDEIEKIQDELDKVNKQLEDTKAIQAKLEENTKRIADRDKEDANHNKAKENLEKLSQDYLGKARVALTSRLLLEVKEKYQDYISQGHTHELFYDNLHINTIEDIIKKGICVCGRPVSSHSEEEKRLIELKAVSLPIESAQNLNLIAQKFKKSVEYQEILLELKDIKSKMSEEKLNMQNHRDKSNSLTKEIARTEEKYGNLDYKRYESLQNSKMEIVGRLSQKKRDLELVDGGIEKGKTVRERIELSNAGNRKVRDVINLVHEIKNEIFNFRREKDSNARDILGENFDSIIKKTLQGNYSTIIDEKYKIQITNMDTGVDETSVLSTGQNIIVSLAFVNALIATAKELSKTIDTNEKYGVIMDAALSNLDESHIYRVSKTNINSLDQLIFMSFKKQLRDEMYNGIKSNIGKAYLLTKNKKGFIEKTELAINQLDTFIHEYEEEENE